MDDLISREKALEEIEDWERCYTWDEHCRELKEDYIVSPSDVIVNLPSAEPRWIPCSERLPDKSGLYLVTTPFDKLMPVHSRYFNKRGEQSFWSGHPMVEVVAWMPLPLPYQAERREDES